MSEAPREGRAFPWREAALEAVLAPAENLKGVGISGASAGALLLVALEGGQLLRRSVARRVAWVR